MAIGLWAWPAPGALLGAPLFAPPEPEQASEPAAETLDLTAGPASARSGDASGSGRSGEFSPNIVIDGEGRKTLVIRGEEPPSPGIIVDESGRKTLVIRGDEAPETAPANPLASGRRPAAERAGKKAADRADAAGRPYWAPPADDAEKPYWLAEKPAPERPYFLKDETPEPPPYWRPAETEEEPPYWRAQAQLPTRPYWLPPEPEPEPEEEEEEDQSALAAAVNDNVKTIAYYKYTDEDGITHLANAPADPRFRLFTLTVEIKLSRGLGRLSSRFTHERLRPHIMKAAALHNLDPALIAAVIKSESAFDAQAVSWAGAQGLMQLMPATARQVGCKNPFDPEDNIMGGSRYLRMMLNRFGGDLTLAVAAYNCGPERVARQWRIPDIKETQNYVKIVLGNYEKYRQNY
ncbi:MAG: lytic transglycosylase domain-containing protein [Candidatus Adiutrix sp.]|nr:lytic transglycosylase domain-containing protein [Candidatus Adiutrix sp.]